MDTRLLSGRTYPMVERLRIYRGLKPMKSWREVFVEAVREAHSAAWPEPAEPASTGVHQTTDGLGNVSIFQAVG